MRINSDFPRKVIINDMSNAMNLFYEGGTMQIVTECRNTFSSSGKNTHSLTQTPHPQDIWFKEINKKYNNCVRQAVQRRLYAVVLCRFFPFGTKTD